MPDKKDLQLMAKSLVAFNTIKNQLTKKPLKSLLVAICGLILSVEA